MKAYTDLEQSKKLADILPIESADMWWNFYSVTTDDTTPQIIHLDTPWVGNFNWDNKPDNVPCWSLAALIEIIRKPTAFDLLIDGRGCRCHCRDKQEGKFYGTDDYCDNAIDACVEIIIKLNEQTL